jgi:hypothetical protein
MKAIFLILALFPAIVFAGQTKQEGKFYVTSSINKGNVKYASKIKNNQFTQTKTAPAEVNN